LINAVFGVVQKEQIDGALKGWSFDDSIREIFEREW
jgi:hypothetical protein